VIVGRGRVIADTSTAGLLAAASGDRVMVRTAAVAEAAAVLERARAAVTNVDSGVLAVSGLSAEKIATVLAGQSVPFSEVPAHRASLEEAYLELTRDAVDYRAAPAGRPRDDDYHHDVVRAGRSRAALPPLTDIEPIGAGNAILASPLIQPSYCARYISADIAKDSSPA
jgi:hypothetical protein